MDGEAGRIAFSDSSFDVAVVDVMLPKLDGIRLIEQVRSRFVTTPILILSARGTVEDRVKGLNAGADDYLVKPFAFSELLARIEALLRRSLNQPMAARLQVEDLVLDRNRHKVFRGGKEIMLQPKELALLEYLMQNAGRVVSKTMIMEHVWDYDFDPETNVVECRVCRLRDKVDRDFEKKLIHTVRGLGYVLEER
ncbi:MAG: response regulator transcription factor [Acidobacteria bacterium]|nr:response regulator transcription factor [Acidobacteriota bacterium]